MLLMSFMVMHIIIILFNILEPYPTTHRQEYKSILIKLRHLAVFINDKKYTLTTQNTSPPNNPYVFLRSNCKI